MKKNVDFKLKTKRKKWIYLNISKISMKGNGLKKCKNLILLFIIPSILL